MSKNLAIFYVAGEDIGDVVRKWPEKNLLLIRVSPMWVRYYLESGECKIIRTTKTLENCGIDTDEQFESLKNSNRLVIIEEPFFELKHRQGISLEKTVFYKLNEALEFVDKILLEQGGEQTNV